MLGAVSEPPRRVGSSMDTVWGGPAVCVAGGPSRGMVASLLNPSCHRLEAFHTVLPASGFFLTTSTTLSSCSRLKPRLTFIGSTSSSRGGQPPRPPALGRLWTTYRSPASNPDHFCRDLQAPETPQGRASQIDIAFVLFLSRP